MSFLFRVAGRSLRDKVRSSVTWEELRSMSHREEAPGKTQDTLERLCLSAGLGTPRVPPEELEEVSGVREVWASLLRLAASMTPGPGSSG
ncbi:hypothetical protein L3Q82_012378 [Scortum barcoo]|uniref:Uncharacterized protein n=1 Tax=Scortum barcoo TaxID=214431 RepID=A0ACB8W2S0_9TELE|nr:hypothetical protein L3Q82_012378 [Scortum barcoo]